MNTKNSKMIVILVAGVVLFATIACGLTNPRLRVGKLQTKSESVELGDSTSVQVEIDMGAGELTMDGGANELLQADFSYNVAELEPEVEYSGGKLIIRSPNITGSVGSLWDLDDYRHEWDLRLNDDVPMEIYVDVGAGHTDLDLGSLSLTRLDINTGAGDVTVDLSDSSTLTRLEIEAGVGQITVDLTGNWQADLDADIQAGVGAMTLLLPRDVGVRVDVQGGLSNIDTSGLTKDGNDYVNDAYGQSDVTLRIDISAGIGDIDLEVGD